MRYKARIDYPLTIEIEVEADTKSKAQKKLNLFSLGGYKGEVNGLRFTAIHSQPKQPWIGLMPADDPFWEKFKRP